jgi:hypothetical protein
LLKTTEGEVMNRNMLMKLVIDLAMLVVMLLAMAYTITGNRVHEWIGAFLFLLFIVHNILNRRWYKTIFTGRYNVQRMVGTTVNLLFLVTMAAALISSVPISRNLFPFISTNDVMLATQIHVLSAYWGFILMAVHIGISWGRIVHAARKMTGITAENRIRTILLRILAVLIVIYGVQASFKGDMGTKLFIYNPFGWGGDDSLLNFIRDHLAIMGIYIWGTHYTLMFVRKKERHIEQ